MHEPDAASTGDPLLVEGAGAASGRPAPVGEKQAGMTGGWTTGPIRGFEHGMSRKDATGDDPDLPPLAAVDFAMLEAEFKREVFGPLLDREVVQAVREVSARYPGWCSPSGRWDDESRADVGQQFVLEKLLERDGGGLVYLFGRNSEVRGVRIGLRMLLGQFLGSIQKRSERTNLFRRADALLAKDPRFRLVADSRKKQRRLWALASWSEAPRYQGGDQRLEAAALGIPGVKRINYGQDARKLSHVLSDADLGDFLAALLAEVGEALTLDDIDRAIAWRFDLLDAAPASLDAVLTDSEGRQTTLGDTVASREVVGREHMLTEVAAAIDSGLKPREREVLAAHVAGESYAEIAKRFGCAKSTVENLVKRAREVAKQHAPDEEPEEVVRQLIDRLTG